MRLIRRLVDLTLAGLVVLVVGLGLGANLGPSFGVQLFAVRTGSMAPDVPVGSLIVVADVATTDIEVGDVVTVRVGSGTTLTHRVTEVVVQDDGRMFQLKGDANHRPDPVLVTDEQVVGRMTTDVPFLGFVLAMLGMPSGIASVLSIGGLLLTIAFLLDELEDAEAADDAEDPELGLDGLDGLTATDVLGPLPTR